MSHEEADMKTLVNCLVTIAMLVSQVGCVGLGVVHGRYADRLTYRDTATLLQEQGPPARKFHDDGKEYWRYPVEGRWAWRGVLIILLATIPLFVPIGSETITYGVDGDRITSIKEERTVATIFGCGGVDIFYKCGLGWDMDFRTSQPAR
jgi:hypothetical protein